MARGKRLDPRQRAAVKAHLLTGDTAPYTARATKTPISTVYDVLAEVRRELAATGTQAEHEAAPWDYTALVMDYLAGALIAQTRQLEVLGDPEWLRQQPAGELAMLHGVLNDKAVRLLVALRQDESGPTANGNGANGNGTGTGAANGQHTPLAVEAPARPAR